MHMLHHKTSADIVDLNLDKKLVRFNQRIVVLSLLMDVMLIAATAIPKTYV